MAVIWSLIPDWLITAAAAGLTGFVALLVGQWRGEKKGQSQANAKTKDADYENADDIRRRVSADRAQRVRELDDAGWRD